MTSDKNQPAESIKTEPDKEGAESPLRLEKFKRAVAIILILVLGLSALTLCLSLPVVYFVDKHKAVLVESVEPAGKVIAITLVDGFLPGRWSRPMSAFITWSMASA